MARQRLSIFKKADCLLELLVNRLLASFFGGDHGSPPNIHIQKRYLWTVSASVRQKAENEYNIYVDMGLLATFYYIAHAQSRALYCSDESVRAELSTLQGSICYLYAQRRPADLEILIQDGAFNSALHEDERTVCDGDVSWFNAIAFIVAHEFSHVALGRGYKVNNPRHHTKVGEQAPSNSEHAVEYAADALAFRRLLEDGVFWCIPDSKKGPLRLADDVGFLFSHLAVTELLTTEPVYYGNTHPHPANRLQALVQSVVDLNTSPQMQDALISHLSAHDKWRITLAERIVNNPGNFRQAPLREVVLEGVSSEGNALLSEAVNKNRQGDNEEALRLTESAAKAFRTDIRGNARNNRKATGWCYNCLGRYYLNIDPNPNLEAAGKYFQLAKEFIPTEDLIFVAGIDSNYASVLMGCGHIKEALALLKDTLTRILPIETDEYGEGYSILYRHIATCQARLGMMTEANATMVAAFQLVARHHDRPRVAYLLKVYLMLCEKWGLRPNKSVVKAIETMGSLQDTAVKPLVSAILEYSMNSHHSKDQDT